MTEEYWLKGVKRTVVEGIPIAYKRSEGELVIQALGRNRHERRKNQVTLQKKFNSVLNSIAKTTTNGDDNNGKR